MRSLQCVGELTPRPSALIASNINDYKVNVSRAEFQIQKRRNNTLVNITLLSLLHTKAHTLTAWQHLRKSYQVGVLVSGDTLAEHS